MKRIFVYTLLLLLVLPVQLFCQSNEIRELILAGIELHDKGEYEAAIKKYEEALKLDPNSSLIQYEMALSYFSNGDYAESMPYCKPAIKAKDDNYLPAAILYGSALDETGETKKAIKFYEKTLKDFPDDYLLNYNASVSCNRIEDFDKAESFALTALSHKFNHPGSNYGLGEIMYNQGSRIKSVLPLYFFLLLEPHTERSKTAFNLLYAQLNMGVKQTADNEITVSVPMDKKDEFSAAELMISLTAASKHNEENEDKSEAEMFHENTKSLFSVLGELKGENSGFWWDNYVPIFYDMVKEGHSEAFCYYISAQKWDDSMEWLAANEDQLDAMFAWLNDE